MKSYIATKDTITQSMQSLDDIVDAPLGQGKMSNYGVIHKIGDQFQTKGVSNIADPLSASIDTDTMMAEGSVGKNVLQG
jgi:hypothetical protein